MSWLSTISIGLGRIRKVSALSKYYAHRSANDNDLQLCF